MTHTPGPWSVGPRRGDESRDVSAGLLHIARVHQGAIANAEANARLIASAPDLYAENKRLRETLEAIESNTTMDCPKDGLDYTEQLAWAAEWCRRKARVALSEGGTP